VTRAALAVLLCASCAPAGGSVSGSIGSRAIDATDPAATCLLEAGRATFVQVDDGAVSVSLVREGEITIERIRVVAVGLDTSFHVTTTATLEGSETRVVATAIDRRDVGEFVFVVQCTN
jgi:hypothetical protein